MLVDPVYEIICRPGDDVSRRVKGIMLYSSPCFKLQKYDISFGDLLMTSNPLLPRVDYYSALRQCYKVCESQDVRWQAVMMRRRKGRMKKVKRGE